MYRVRVRVRVRVRDRDRDRVRNRVMSECGALVVHLRMCGRRRELRTAQLKVEEDGCVVSLQHGLQSSTECEGAHIEARGMGGGSARAMVWSC